MKNFPERITDQDQTVSRALSNQEQGPWRILLVEDDPDQQRLLMHILQKAGAEVTLECNGRAAFELICNHPDEFELIVTDLQMPILDGIELTEKIRKAGFAVPIVMCTSIDDPVVHKHAQLAGCNAVVTKDSVLAELVNQARQLSDEASAK